MLGGGSKPPSFASRLPLKSPDGFFGPFAGHGLLGMTHSWSPHSTGPAPLSDRPPTYSIRSVCRSASHLFRTVPFQIFPELSNSGSRPGKTGGFPFI